MERLGCGMKNEMKTLRERCVCVCVDGETRLGVCVCVCREEDVGYREKDGGE